MKNFENKYVIGLDLGIASVGWAAMEIDENAMPTGIIDTGVVVVESMEDDKGNLRNADRRGYRGARRTLNRRNERVRRIKALIKNDLYDDKNKNLAEIFYINNTSVYELKVRGTKSQLSKDELTKCLVHYAKHRGFKSNRKDLEASDDGKILKAIKENTEGLEGITYSQYILNQLDGVNKVKNSTEGDYKFSFLRDQVEKEIKLLLSKQLEYNVIDQKFSDKYIEIWSSQRDFSEGPSYDPSSERHYTVDFSTVFGLCNYHNNDKIPKDSPWIEINNNLDEVQKLRGPKESISQQINTLLGKLCNLRYKLDSLEYNYDNCLTLEQIKKLYDYAMLKSVVKYSDVLKVLDVEYAEFKGVSLSKEDFIKVLKSYKEKNNIDSKTNIDFKDEKFKKFIFNETKKKVIFDLTSNKALLKYFKNTVGEEVYKKMPIEYKDDIITGLTFYKTDERIKDYFCGNVTEKTKTVSLLDWEQYPEVVNEVILKIKASFTESAALSLLIVRKLNEEILKGFECPDQKLVQYGLLVGTTYDKAMANIGLNHSELEVNINRSRKLKNMTEILDEQYKNEISNPRVIRVLARSGSVINALIAKYGMPKYINIEVARDINLKRGKRSILENEQLNNLTSNERIKAEILLDYPNKKYSKISKYDIEKYKLYKEQNGMCAYSMTPISPGDLLTELYQIDHIVPYSVSKINNFQNKTLVKTSANQNKTNLLPLAYFRSINASNEQIEKFKNFINQNNNMSSTKKSYYLLNSYDEMESSFGDRALGDTRFITKYLTNILNNNLAFVPEEDKDGRQINVISHKAGYVNYFKKSCGISQLTHSLENEKYKKFSNLEITDIECKTTKKGYQIQVDVIDTVSKKNYTSILETVSTKETSPKFIIARNENLENLYLNLDLVDFSLYLGQGINATRDNAYISFLDVVLRQDLRKDVKASLEYVFSYIKADFAKQLIKKNRDNHLHHALDAIAVAALTRSVVANIAKYEKHKEEVILKINKKIPANFSVGTESQGFTTIEELNEFERRNIKNLFPIPYKEFKNEVIAFVYERDNEIQKQLVGDKPIHPLIPVIRKKKRYEIKNGKKGKTTRFLGLHKETVFGETAGVITKSVSVLELDIKKVKNIVGKETFAKTTYQAVYDWFKDGKQTKYPMLANGREVKKVKIEAIDRNKAYYLGDERGGYAQSENIVRIDVFKDKDSDRLYFVGRNAINLSQELNGKLERLTMWYGQNNKKIEIEFNEKYTFDRFNDDYKLVCKLHPGDFVNVEKKADNDGEIRSLDVYIVGFTGGSLQISSPIGDNFDTSRYLGIGIDSKQLKITVSTIAKIQKLKISILGYVK